MCHRAISLQLQQCYFCTHKLRFKSKQFCCGHCDGLVLDYNISLRKTTLQNATLPCLICSHNLDLSIYYKRLQRHCDLCGLMYYASSSNDPVEFDEIFSTNFNCIHKNNVCHGCSHATEIISGGYLSPGIYWKDKIRYSCPKCMLTDEGRKYKNHIFHQTVFNACLQICYGMGINLHTQSAGYNQQIQSCDFDSLFSHPDYRPLLPNVLLPTSLTTNAFSGRNEFIRMPPAGKVLRYFIDYDDDYLLDPEKYTEDKIEWLYKYTKSFLL